MYSCILVQRTHFHSPGRGTTVTARNAAKMRARTRLRPCCWPTAQLGVQECRDCAGGTEWCGVLTLQGSTFGIPGVLEHAHFLRDVKQSEAIRLKIIENLALAGIPGENRANTWLEQVGVLSSLCEAPCQPSNQVCLATCAWLALAGVPGEK